MNLKDDPRVPEEMRALAWLYNLTIEMQVPIDGGPSAAFNLRHPCGECMGFIYEGRPLEELNDLCKKLEAHHAGFDHKQTRNMGWPQRKV